eukprot:1794787-Amphidinium_carterae.1
MNNGASFLPEDYHCEFMASPGRGFWAFGFGLGSNFLMMVSECVLRVHLPTNGGTACRWLI